MIRRRSAALLLAVGLICAACTSKTSGQGAGSGSNTPPTSGGTASTPAGSSSVPASGTSTVSPANGDWIGRTNFATLQHTDMGCGSAGLGGKVNVLKVVSADVTGDGVPDAIVTLECAHSASEWPDTVDVYSDAHGSPTLIGAVLTPHDSAYATQVTTSGQTITVLLTTWSSFAPGCCPDLQYTQTSTWNGHGFTVGARVNHLHSCGDTAFVTTAGPTQGATGHSVLVLLFKNRLPQPCTVHGYPGLDAITSGGSVLAHATRTLNGFGGGAHSIATITIAAGASASATAEWMNFDPSGGGSCATSASIMVTPANTSATASLPVSVTVCSLQIHPTVAGTSGQG